MKMSEHKCNKKMPADITREILKNIEDIAFGEVVITIHDSRIVQIEKTEKKRF